MAIPTDGQADFITKNIDLWREMVEEAKCIFIGVQHSFCSGLDPLDPTGLFTEPMVIVRRKEGPQHDYKIPISQMSVARVHREVYGTELVFEITKPTIDERLFKIIQDLQAIADELTSIKKEK